MDHDAAQDIKSRYEAVLKHSSLDVIVPRSKQLNAESLVSKQSDELQRSSVRTHIFFDELTTVHVVLRSLSAEVNDLLPYLDLAISAHATNTTDGAAGPASSKQELVFERVAGSAFEQSVKVGTAHHIAWTKTLHVLRPRSRLQRPAIYFTAVLGLSTSFIETSKKVEKQYLPSFQTASANVLESLQLSNTDTRLYLAESRITKVLPPSPRGDDALKSLRGASKRALTAGPAFVPRIRCVALPDKVLLSLHVEAAPQLPSSVELNSITVKVTNATATQLGNVNAMRLNGGDELAFTYQIVPKARSEGVVSSGLATVAIKAAILLEDTEIRLEVEREWYIDMRTQRTWTHQAWSGTPKPPMRPMIDDGEIVFDFQAPRTAIAGSDFDLSVRCINNSPRTRHFVVRVDALEETVAMPANALAKTPDVRMDFIKPGESFETNVRYTALAAGVLDLGLISIVDLDSKESIEVHDLPNVIAHE